MDMMNNDDFETLKNIKETVIEMGGSGSNLKVAVLFLALNRFSSEDPYGWEWIERIIFNKVDNTADNKNMEIIKFIKELVE